MKRKTIIVLALLSLSSMSLGQTLTDLQPTGEPLQLPATVCGMSLVDDEIYCFTKELPLMLSENHGMLGNVEPDRIVPRRGVTYATRNPETGELFYTSKFWFFNTKLYAIPYGKDGKGSALRPGGCKMSMEHPAISENGNYMVFSSKSKHGHGKDLYITVKTGNVWTYPEPITDANSPGNETCPTLWHNYLIFASDGQNNSRGGSDLYAIKINVTISYNDSLGYSVEKNYGRLQALPAPLNSDRNERVAVVHNGRTYVVRDGDSTAMGDILIAYNGTPDLVAIYGTIVDEHNHPQPRTQIVITSNDNRPIETLTNTEGRYSLFLKKDVYYNVNYGKVSYSAQRQAVDSRRLNDDNLIEERKMDIVLTSYDPGQYIEMQGLFGDNAAVELTKEGRDKLAMFIAFLSGNPAVQVQMTMYCGLESDKEFNKIIAGYRARNLLEYIQSRVPAAKNITVTNGGGYTPKNNNAPKVNDLLTIKLGVF